MAVKSGSLRHHFISAGDKSGTVFVVISASIGQYCFTDIQGLKGFPSFRASQDDAPNFRDVSFGLGYLRIISPVFASNLDAICIPCTQEVPEWLVTCSMIDSVGDFPACYTSIYLRLASLFAYRIICRWRRVCHSSVFDCHVF